ncbi:MAG: hypothetical protein JXR49_21820 [Acidobacteria bacterium]|nr:hypothetical protein [Acidobacteriota bacterium]
MEFKKNGFTECGCFKGIGKKNGRVFDEIWIERKEGRNTAQKARGIDRIIGKGPESTAINCRREKAKRTCCLG